MRAVILAAGEGSRMDGETGDVPKAFMNLGGRTLYDRQRAVLNGNVDDVTVVLGYAAENVAGRVGDADVVVVEDWDEYDNAESLRRALAGVDDHVLVLNGDVLVTESVVTRVLDFQRPAPAGRNVVACVPGYQEESTAIRCDDSGVVTDYGMIRGHRHAGMGVVDRSTVDDAERFLRDHREEWYPVLYPEFETEMVPIPRAQHVEINYPRDKAAAKQKLPLDVADEADAQT
jgi:choline kinase